MILDKKKVGEEFGELWSGGGTQRAHVSINREKVPTPGGTKLLFLRVVGDEH